MPANSFPRTPAILAILATAMHFATGHAADTSPPATPLRITPRPITPSPTIKQPTLDELFAEFDKDHDGRISREEARADNRLPFLEWDADGDGFATREEIHNYRMRHGLDDNANRIAGFTPQPGAAGNRRSQQSARFTAQAVVLKEPTDWRLEIMSVPQSFAPGVKLKGTEEIRFAPGMFDNTSTTYFTCILGLTLDGAPELNADDLRDFLEQYYRGLSLAVGRRKGLKPDPEQMRAEVESQPAASDTPRRFTASVIFFDTFSDGRKITLNVEGLAVRRPSAKQTSLILMVSPSGKDTTVWKDLRALGERTATKAAESP